MPYFQSISDMVGGTPLLELRRFCAARKLGGRIFAKLEVVLKFITLIFHSF